MQNLHAWLQQQRDGQLVELNSVLGGVLRSMLKHWETLPLFVRQVDAPLNNNICERALKQAIRHRKNALFDKTSNGDRVGDVLMSLIPPCAWKAANPFDYLTEWQQSADAVAAHPEQWLPWNYQAALPAEASRTAP
jgi:hypothetical protein